MKQLIACILIIGLSLSCLTAQTKEYKTKDGKQIIINMSTEIPELPEPPEIPVNPKMVIKMNKEMGLGNTAPDAPYMGIFVEDLTFPKAQELGYKGFIGVLITGVVSDSPAWNHRLQEDDILIAMDGKEVTNNAVFDKLRKLYRAGDKVALELYRSGEIVKMDFTFGSRQAKTPSETEIEIKTGKKKKLSPGYGGGSWTPLWFTGDMKDINYMLAEMGFGKLNEDGILMQGGAGKGPIGKGFFIGGAGYGYSTTDQIPAPNDAYYHIRMKYSNSIGGVTLDKRVPITKGIITSVGVLLGGGNHSLEVMKNNSNYDWNSFNSTFLNSQNTHSTISRSYLLVQPKGELLVRFLPWLGLRAEAGYVYGYSPSHGWKVDVMDSETIDIQNSPDTKYEGLSFSAGPWFGF